jgi:hypothetical protein
LEWQALAKLAEENMQMWGRVAEAGKQGRDLKTLDERVEEARRAAARRAAVDKAAAEAELRAANAEWGDRLRAVQGVDVKQLSAVLEQARADASTKSNERKKNAARQLAGESA